jgi:hypothetical protein
MKRLVPVLSIVVLLAATFGAGALHGRLSGRWGVEATAQSAAEKLTPDFPVAFGNWQQVSEVPLGDEVVRVLQCPAYISRTYKHQQTGDLATVAVLLGPPGPISVHTPEICYSSRDFSISGERRKVTVHAPEGVEQAFWELPLTKNNVHASPLRVLYGWSAGKNWEAARYPRFGYGGLSHLYKLQVAVTANAATKPSEFDAGRDFLKAFLVQLRPRLIEAHTPGEIDL